jgi:hypothetical protein
MNKPVGPQMPPTQEMPKKMNDALGPKESNTQLMVFDHPIWSAMLSFIPRCGSTKISPA